VADAAEATRATERRLEELGGEVVTTNAGVMREVFGHWLIGVSGFLFTREMTISALNLDVFLLIVRKASVSGSVLDLFNRERPLFVCKRRREQNPADDHGRSAQQKGQLKIENYKLQTANLSDGSSKPRNFQFAFFNSQFSIPFL